LIILIAVASIVLSLVRISDAEKELSGNIQLLNDQNDQYTGITEEIYYLDEILTTSAYMYVYTDSDHWKKEYYLKRKRLAELLNDELMSTADDSIRHALKHLKIAEIHLTSLENEAIRLSHRDDSASLEVLNSDAYWHHKEDYSSGLYEIAAYLDRIKARNNEEIASNLESNRLMYFLILFINLATWSVLVLLFNRSRHTAQMNNRELNRINTALNESLQLERVSSKKGGTDAVIDKYLGFLEQHLPFGAYYFIEQAKDEVDVRGMVRKAEAYSIQLRDDFFEAGRPKKVIDEVVAANESRGMSRGTIVPESKLLDYKNNLEGIFTPIKTDNGRNALLYVDASHIDIKQSDIGILNTISNQFRISLENASIYSQLEDKIQKRTNELRRLNLKLQKSEQRLMNIFENTLTGVIASNKANKFTMVNSQFCSMLGYTREELLKMKLTDLVLMEGKDRYELSMKRLIEGELGDFTMELQYKSKDGRKVTALTRAFAVHDKKGVFFESLSSVLDITDQVEASKKIMESITETENMERTRIATTLHDSIGQNLTSLHLMLTSLSKSENLDELDRQHVDKVIDITKRTILETRQISHNLMPKHITRFGLIASVENLVQDLNNTSSGINFSLYHNFKDEVMSVSEQINIYRIIQESVNNILKYARANNVYIQMVRHSNIITVLVDDDGDGFDLEKTMEKESLGLRSIKDRAKSISADLEIDSKVGRGTTISVQLTV
jgi:PAS domain S-box-containing protein